MFVLIENGNVIAEEQDYGNACELQMVLNEDGRDVIVMDEIDLNVVYKTNDFWDQQAEIAEMQAAAEKGTKLW